MPEGSSSSPEACVLDGSVPVYGGNAKKTFQSRLASRVPRRMPGMRALTPHEPKERFRPGICRNGTFCFGVADRGPRGRRRGIRRHPCDQPCPLFAVVKVA